MDVRSYPEDLTDVPIPRNRRTHHVRPSRSSVLLSCSGILAWCTQPNNQICLRIHSTLPVAICVCDADSATLRKIAGQGDGQRHNEWSSRPKGRSREIQQAPIQIASTRPHIPFRGGRPPATSFLSERPKFRKTTAFVSADKYVIDVESPLSAARRFSATHERADVSCKLSHLLQQGPA